MPSAPCVERSFQLQLERPVVTQSCCFQKIWQGQRRVASSWKDLLHSLEVGGVSVAHCEMNADGKFMPLPGKFWWAALANSREMDQQGTGEGAQQSLFELLLVKDLAKPAFGLWGCAQSAAWTPPVWQVRLFPEMTPCWLKHLCSFVHVTAWIRTPFVLTSFPFKCTQRFFSWCLLSMEQFCPGRTRDLNECTQTEMKNSGERSHPAWRKICPKCKLLMLRCCSDVALVCSPLTPVALLQTHSTAH